MAEAEAGTTSGTGPAAGTTGAAPQGTGTSAPAPKTGEGQPGQAQTAGTTGKQDAGTAQTAEETFFDPKSVPPELMPAYKEMQKAFSKKTELLSKNRQKIEAYDAFSKDPVGQIQQMAQRLGYRLTRAEAAAAAAEASGTAPQGEWEPKTWNEVTDRIGQAVQSKLLEQLAPVITQVQEMRKSNIEKMLDDSAPDWRQYEDEMRSNLQAHPSLVNDPVKLYRLSVPPEVFESRAAQAALKKLESKVKGAQVGGTSTTTKHQAAGIGDKPLTFNEAVAAAKAALAEQGIHPPGGRG